MTENENEELKDIVMEGFPVLEHTSDIGKSAKTCRQPRCCPS